VILAVLDIHISRKEKREAIILMVLLRSRYEGPGGEYHRIER